MNTRILLLGMAATALTSCATAYKTGQTPDDVYYSPAKPEEEYVRKEEDDNRNRDDYYTLDDYRLRMQVRNRNRYCACSDDWYYDNWNTGSSWRYGWNNPWTWNSNYNSGWYYSYNPWCYSPYPSYNTTVTTKTFNYKPPIRNFGNTNTVATTYNPKTGYSITRTDKPVKVYNNSNRNNGGGFLGGLIRTVLTPGSSNSGSSGNNNRTYSPSSSGSSGSRSSGSSSSSSGSSARPARNGKG